MPPAVTQTIFLYVLYGSCNKLRPLYSINLVFLMGTDRVLCEVGTLLILVL
jgi:hypothetical protein